MSELRFPKHVLSFYKLALRLSLCHTAGKVLPKIIRVRKRGVWEVVKLLHYVGTRPDKEHRDNLNLFLLQNLPSVVKV